jgi:hypothetical protein
MYIDINENNDIWRNKLNKENSVKENEVKNIQRKKKSSTDIYKMLLVDHGSGVCKNY